MAVGQQDGMAMRGEGVDMAARIWRDWAIGLAVAIAVPGPVYAQEVAQDGADIVVIARRLRLVKIDYRTVGRHLQRCDILKSTGDARLDNIACGVVKACVAQGHVEPGEARRCFLHRVDTLDDPTALPAKVVVVPDKPIDPAPRVEAKPGQASVPPADPRRDPHIVVEGRRPYIAPGLWELTLTSILYPPSTVRHRASPAMIPPDHWRLCVPEEAVEDSMIRLLGGSPERKHVLSGCSAMKLVLDGGKVKGSYSCLRSGGSNDARITGRFDQTGLDVSVNSRLEENVLPSEVQRPGMVDTSERVYEVRSRLIARRIGLCGQP